MGEKISQRGLNRALLARQMLLKKEGVPTVEALERLVGLQAQQARPPFVGLWSRVEGFRREDLKSLVEERQAIRGTMMRCTLHLLSRRDFVAFRPVLQPVLTGAMRSILGARAGTFDLQEILEIAAGMFRQQPRTFTEIRQALIEHYPEADERAMGYAVRTHLPLVIVPNEHDWSFRADPLFTLAEEWLGQPLPDQECPREIVRRYLAAFGPATPADVQAWSGLRGLAPVLKALRPELATFRDERGRELFDLPEAPRPHEETPAPARFIAEFDNLILSHADRTRVIADEYRPPVMGKNAVIRATVLTDGFIAGMWRVTRSGKRATLTVEEFAPLPSSAREELAAEAESLVSFVEPEAQGFDLQFTPV